MADIKDLFTLSTEDFVKAYRNFKTNDSEGFNAQLAVWITLKERILSGESSLFDKYLIPLLTPLINRYITSLPEYGTWREDFKQEVQIDFYFHLTDYEPYYGDGAYLGTVFFTNRLRTVYKRFCREKDKTFGQASLDNEEENWGDRLFNNDDIHTSFVKEEILHVYEKNKEQYSEYYARKVTRKWSEVNGYDIFS